MGKQVEKVKEILKIHLDYIDEYNKKSVKTREDKTKYDFAIDRISTCCRLIRNETFKKLNEKEEEKIINDLIDPDIAAQKRIFWLKDQRFSNDDIIKFVKSLSENDYKNNVEKANEIDKFISNNFNNIKESIDKKVNHQIVENYFLVSNDNHLDLLNFLEDNGLELDLNSNFDDYKIDYDNYSFKKEDKKNNDELNKLLENETDENKIKNIIDLKKFSHMQILNLFFSVLKILNM